MGDKLRIKEYELLQKATSRGEKNNLEARVKSLGINLVIQGKNVLPSIVVTL